MRERLEDKVDEHDRMLVEMQTILKGIADSQNKMADSMSVMTLSIGKIDLWLEKISNLDTNTKESFKRTYKVIDGVESKLAKESSNITESVSELENKVDEGFKDLEVARFFSKYPKLLLMVVVGFCVLNIEPIRKIIFGG